MGLSNDGDIRTEKKPYRLMVVHASLDNFGAERTDANLAVSRGGFRSHTYVSILENLGFNDINPSKQWGVDHVGKDISG